MNFVQQLMTKRDAKAIPHLEQYAPVWIESERIIDEDESLLFNVVFQHPQYGWVSRRYKFDGFNNVLYYKGQTLTSEEKALEIQQKDPYITTAIADIPNSYGG